MRRAAGIAALLLSLLAAQVCSGPAARAQSADHYNLVLVWMPGLCAIEGDRPECKDLTLRRYDGLNLAFLALQVARDSGIAQTFCFTMPSASEMDRERRWCDMDEPPVADTIKATLAELMPVSQSCQDRALYARFGSCTLYSADDYYSRGIKLTQAMAGTKVNTRIAGAVGATVSQTALVEAFEADFGDDSGTAIDFVCRKVAGRSHLLQVKVSLTARALTRGLDKDFLWKPKGKLRRSCPETIIVDAPPGAASGAGEATAAPTEPAPTEPAPAGPAPAAPTRPAEPPVPDSAPVAPVESAPLEPTGPKKY